MNIEVNNRKIKVNNELLLIIKKHIQYKIFSREAGGILIGRENCYDNNLIIEHITQPFPNDRRALNRFYRKDKKHIEKFHQLYDSIFHVYAYVGEWHTHHESIPNYSIIDYHNWKKIGDESPIKKVFYHIISGNKAFRIWEYDSNTQKIRLINTTFWSDI